MTRAFDVSLVTKDFLLIKSIYNKKNDLLN